MLIQNNVAWKPLETFSFNPHTRTHTHVSWKNQCVQPLLRRCVCACLCIGSQTNWTNGALSFYEWNSLAPLLTRPFYPLRSATTLHLNSLQVQYALAAFLLHGAPCTPLAVEEETLAIHGFAWTPLLHWLLGVFRAHNTWPHSHTLQTAHTLYCFPVFSGVCHKWPTDERHQQQLKRSNLMALRKLSRFLASLATRAHFRSLHHPLIGLHYSGVC